MSTTYHPILKGGFELHVHSSPSLFPRVQTDWELVEDIKAAEMAGAIIKSHESPTMDRATLIREKEQGLHIYGGIALNEHTGGISVRTVETALKLGAKIIWMPTISTVQHWVYFQSKQTKLFSTNAKIKPDEGLTIWGEKGKIRSELFDILDLISKHDAILATGHLSPKEVSVLVDIAIERKVEKILIQHPDMGIAKIPMEMQQELVKKGCILEKCYLACSNDFEDLTVADMARTIEILGADHCVLVTDYGQKHNIPAIAALSEFLYKLATAGVKETDLEKMVQTNPRALLSL